MNKKNKFKTTFRDRSKKLVILLLVSFVLCNIYAEPCGDVNSDMTVNIIDALMTAQHYVGLNPQPFNPSAADVSGDGMITIVDALQIAQFYVGLIPELTGCREPITPNPVCTPATYELQAEDGTYGDAAIESDHTGYTGSGYVNTVNAVGRWIEWTVGISAASGVECAFRYAHESGDRPMDLTVNGSPILRLNFPASGAWATWAVESAEFNLPAGSSTIRLTTTVSSGAPNIDKMDLTINCAVIATPTPTPPPTPTPAGYTLPPTPQVRKARVIASTDGEVDDRSSMVRFLMYASDYDIVGIVENNSIFQKSGHSKDDWLEKELGYYGQVLPNLLKHNPDYPSVAYLQSVVRVGNENPDDLQSAPPNMKTQDTPGSDLIIERLLDNDPRPLHVPCWGGANTVAFALWRLKTSYPQEFARAASRLRVYGITYNLTNKAQDGGYVWIIKNMPEVKIYTAASWAGTYSYDSVDGERNPSKNPVDVQRYMNRSWTSTNIKTNHGPLGAYYPQAYISEGDTPSFLPLIANGLEAHNDYTLGGWGGRAVYDQGNHMVDAPDEKYQSVYRWTITAQNDFAARMDWGVASSYSGANHNPRAKVAGGTEIYAAPGSRVNLDASETTDPDGDNLTFKWWQYHEADSASAKVSISNATSRTGAGFEVPNERGKQVHIILEVTDNGTPPLTHYQRIIVNIQ